MLYCWIMTQRKTRISLCFAQSGTSLQSTQTKIPTSLCYAQSHQSLRRCILLAAKFYEDMAWNKLLRVRIEIIAQTKTPTSLCYAQSHQSLRSLRIACS